MEFTGERFVPDVLQGTELAIEHLQRYRTITELVKDKVVVDAACGEGYGSFMLSEYAREVYGLDIDEAAISHAAGTYHRENLNYIRGSIAELPFDNNSIDIVVSYETIEHVSAELQEQFIREIQRVLTPNGFLIISTPNKAVYSDLHNHTNHFHVKEFYYDEFQQFLSQFFKNVQFFNQRFNVSSVISNERTNKLDIIKLQEVNLEIIKYVIAVCGNDDGVKDVILESVVLDSKDRYEGFQQRIIELQKEVAERNEHIQRLDLEITAKDNRILELQSEVEERNIWAKGLESDLICNREKLTVIKEKVGQDIFHKEQELQQIINNQRAHIEQLLDRERLLERIMNSHGWKMLRGYYKFRDLVFPVGTKRRIFSVILYKLLRKPRLIPRMITIKNLKKVLYYNQSASGSFLEQKVITYLNRHDEEGSSTLKLYSTSGTYERLTFPVVEKPSVSIIIPVYNQWDYTYACLRSILENTMDVPYEVIIADDLSTDDTVNIRRYVDNVTVVRDRVNRGFLLNCNHAAKYAKGDFMLFLNNDTNVQENWLSSLLNLMQSDEKIGMVGSKLVYSDGRLQEAGGIIWNDASGWNYGRLDDPEKPEYNYVKKVDYISGASIMIRKFLWNEIGGFDERYAPAYFEDTDLAFEVRKKGYDVVYQPKSVVVHFEGISHGTDSESGVKQYQSKNRIKFQQKWKDILENENFKNAQNLFWARDRTRTQKTILVIDHYVPHYDKDAGSRAVYQYLQLFLDMGLNVKFIGDNLYRHEPYTSDLQRLGVEVIYGSWYVNRVKEWLRENGKYINYVFLNRPHISIRYIDDIRQFTNAKVLYFGHDLHYLREMREYEITLNNALKKSAQRWHEIESELIQKSDVVYYPSQVEIEKVKNEFPSVTARAIPLYLFDKAKGNKKRMLFSERQNILFVGGFGHKPNVDAVLWFVSEIFPKILRKIPSMIFYIVGSNPPDSIKELQSSNIVVTGYVTDEELLRYYASVRLVVAPLRYGAGVKGKIVEAIYNGVPVVTTSIGAEGLPDADYYLTVCDDASDFAAMIEEIYQDVKNLDEKSREFENYISSHFTFDTAQKLLSQDIEP